MDYIEMKRRQTAEVSEFPMFFAFNKEQFARGMESLGLTEEDTDKVYRYPAGGFIRRADSEAFRSMFDRHEKERAEALEDDGFLLEALRYELANHEYCVTYDATSALEALDLGEKAEDKRIKRILEGAVEMYLAEVYQERR